MKHKGQLNSTDLIMVTSTLILLFTISIFLWNTNVSRIAIKEEIQSLESTAITLSDLFVTGGGIPEDWEDEVPREYLNDSNTTGLWHMNEGVGSSIFDSSRYGNRGSISGATWRSDHYCKFSSCLEFRGSPSVIIPNQAQYNTQNFTVELWISPEPSFGAFSGVERAIINKEGLELIDGSLTPTGWRVKLLSDMRIAFWVSGVGEWQTPVSVPTYRLTHLAFSVEKTPPHTDVSIYFNGVRVFHTTPAGTPQPSTFPILLGIHPQLSPYRGLMDDVRISNAPRRFSNITSFGLVDSSHELNLEKIKTFIDLDYDVLKNSFSNNDFYLFSTCLNNYTTNYTATISGLGICSQPIAYVARDYPYSMEVMRMLNYSGLVWDFYWGGRNSEIRRNQLTARNIYIADLDNDENDGEALTSFQWMIQNISAYNSVISEDMHVHFSQLTQPERDALGYFVNRSGKTYFHIEDHEDSLEIFRLTLDGGNEDEGIFVTSDLILHDLGTGTRVEFFDNAQTFEIGTSPIPVKVLMAVYGDPSRCIFCKWTYGNGTIYYMPHTNITEIDGVGVRSTYLSGLDIAGEIAGTGNFSYNAENIINIRRTTLLNKQPIFLNFVVWK